MSSKLVKESFLGVVGGGGAFERLPCAFISMVVCWLLPAGISGKLSPRGLLLNVNGAAETTESERYESPIKEREAAETSEECIMDYVSDSAETPRKWEGIYIYNRKLLDIRYIR